MALHVVLGFETSGNSSPAVPVYVGRDADEAMKSRDAYPGARTLWLRNPRGISKMNQAASAARDAEARDADAARAAGRASQPVSVEQRLADAQSENVRLKRELDKAKRAASILAEPAPAPVAPSPELALDGEILPMVPSSEPVADVPVDAATGEEGPSASEADDAGEVEDPDAAARRQAAEAAAAAAEEIETGGGKKKGKK